MVGCLGGGGGGGGGRMRQLVGSPPTNNASHSSRGPSRAREHWGGIGGAIGPHPQPPCAFLFSVRAFTVVHCVSLPLVGNPIVRTGSGCPMLGAGKGTARVWALASSTVLPPPRPSPSWPWLPLCWVPCCCLNHKLHCARPGNGGRSARLRAARVTPAGVWSVVWIWCVFVLSQCDSCLRRPHPPPCCLP